MIGIEVWKSYGNKVVCHYYDILSFTDSEVSFMQMHDNAYMGELDDDARCRIEDLLSKPQIHKDIVDEILVSVIFHI